MRQEHVAEGMAAAAKSTVAAGIVGATIFGFTINEFAALMGCCFILMQMAHLAWKWIGEWRERKRFAAKMAEPMSPPE